MITISSVYGINDPKPIFSFGVLADVQYSRSNPAGTRFYSNSLNKLAESITTFSENNLNFVIQLGDLIDSNIESYDSVLSFFNKIKSDKYHVLGNHDFSVTEAKKANVPKLLNLDSSYYDFVVKGWRLIVLDGTDLSFYGLSKSQAHLQETEILFQNMKDQGKKNAFNWNGGLGSQQISWLEDNLEQASLLEEKVILFCHFPVYPSREENLWNDVELIPLLESYPCVVAFFSGHYHAGNYAKKRGIHYLTFQGMVETEKENAYSIIEVYSDHLKILGFGREPNRILTFKKDQTQNDQR
ncbi:metallophosphoesterase [Acidobacteriota bacterium]